MKQYCHKWVNDEFNIDLRTDTSSFWQVVKLAPLITFTCLPVMKFSKSIVCWALICHTVSDFDFTFGRAGDFERFHDIFYPFWFTTSWDSCMYKCFRNDKRYFSTALITAAPGYLASKSVNILDHTYISLKKTLKWDTKHVLLEQIAI